MDEVEQQIRDAIEPIPEEAFKGSWSDSVWTREIKNRVARIGKLLKFSVCANRSDHSDDHEWLYDLIWLDADENNLLLSAPLSMEIEWGSLEDIIYDFEKLLTANSKYKVMVFQGDDVSKTTNDLIQKVAKFRSPNPNERYLFIAYDWNFEAFQLRSFQRGKQ